jgi:hypothetical protein
MKTVVPHAQRGPAAAAARWRWWFALALAITLPWFAVLGSAALLDAWLPGVVLTTHWKLFSSGAFLAGAVAAAGLVWATSEPLALRVIASGLLLLGGVLLALMMQIQPRCEDEYVGRRPSAAVADCGGPGGAEAHAWRSSRVRPPWTSEGGDVSTQSSRVHSSNLSRGTSDTSGAWP